MSKTKITTEAIGAELVEAARSTTDEVLPLSTRLFPYIFIASRRMSLRAISRWLEEKHKVSLSAAAISRALNSSEGHLERLAESIAAPARYVASSYGFSPIDLLFLREFENGPTQLDLLSNENANPEGEHDISRWSEMQNLASVWNPIPHEVKLLLEPYLNEFLADFLHDEA